MSNIQQDSRWMAEHGQELHDQYRGKWIAVWHEQVIGVGEGPVEAMAQAEEKAPRGEYILSCQDYEVDVV